MTERLPPPDVSRFPELSANYVRALPAGELLGRIHFMGGEHPTWWNTFRSFGPTSCRFDHHDGEPAEHRDRSILYGVPKVLDARQDAVPILDVCLVEVFRDTGVVNVSQGRPHFALFRLKRTIRLLDVVDSDWVTHAGGNASISSGSRLDAREWSKAIYTHYPGDLVDGLYYGCSNMPRARSVALYERARSALEDSPQLDLPLSSPGLAADLEHACSELGLQLVYEQ